jgi:hypothetical protein
MHQCAVAVAWGDNLCGVGVNDSGGANGTVAANCAFSADDRYSDVVTYGGK